MTARTTTRAHGATIDSGQGEQPALAGKEYLTTAEFAEAMSISIRTVRNWMKTGIINATRVGPRLIRIPATEIQRAAVPIAEPAIAPRPVSRNRR